VVKSWKETEPHDGRNWQDATILGACKQFSNHVA